MIYNVAGLGFLGPEHLAQCCAPTPEVPTWFAAAHEDAGREEAAAVAQAEAYLARRSTVAFYERRAPEPLGVPVRRGRADPAQGTIPARRDVIPGAANDSEGDTTGDADNSSESSNNSGSSSMFECSMMALDDAMVAP